MKDLQGLRVVVAGAGAIGSLAALSLARAGARVVLADPGGPNASQVAAGMLAPLCESLFDPLSAGHFTLLRQARDAWAALAGAQPSLPAIDRCGALLQTVDPTCAADLLNRAAAMGAVLERRGEALFSPEDWRLEPQPTLTALHDAFTGIGGVSVKAAVQGLEDGVVGLTSGETLRADALVLATGHEGPGPLVPIKGQLLRFAGAAPTTGPILRGEGIYAAPSLEGVVVGATMETGRSDLAIDPAAVEALRAAAVRLLPHLAGAPFAPSAGVRAATLDGLPLVGPWGGDGVFIARGARRNGWLLAPLVAEVLIERLAGPARSPAAHAFAPSRFVKD